jgi:hypothetical protein
VGDREEDLLLCGEPGFLDDLIFDANGEDVSPRCLIP